MGNKLDNPHISQKSYLKIIHRMMNTCRAPKIPHLLINNPFILDCKAKANHFNDFFAKQCKLIINDSVLPNFSPLTNKRIDHITIKNEEIISIIRNLNPNKTNGSDGI